MERLTIPDEKIPGGTRRKIISMKAVKEEAMTLYWQLKKYEDTGLTPEQLLELDGLYLEKCREVAALRGQNRWIPVEERPPEDLQEVLATDGQYVYLVEYDSDYGYGDMDGITAWMPPPEPYQPED